METAALNELRSLVGRKVTGVGCDTKGEHIDFDLVFDDGRALEVYFKPDGGGWCIEQADAPDGTITALWTEPPDEDEEDAFTTEEVPGQGRIVCTPGIRFGKPRIQDTRITVGDILSWLSAGMTPEEIMADYRVTDEDIRAALAYAAKRFDVPAKEG